MVLVLKGIFLTLAGFGVFLIMQVILPIASYKIWELNNFKNSLPLTAPISAESEVLGVSVVDAPDNFPTFTSNKQRPVKPGFTTFLISIPKLSISEAKVTLDSNDIEDSLGHLPGSALPGEKGNVFISGHSSPLTSQFKSPNMYKSIFSSLHKLEKGDKVIILAGGQIFTYSIYGFKIVDPKDLSVIAPPDTLGRYISLMTCVPPGINTKRLIVMGKLE